MISCKAVQLMKIITEICMVPENMVNLQFWFHSLPLLFDLMNFSDEIFNI